MIRKGLMLTALATGALVAAGQAQASVELAAQSGIINKLHSSSAFTNNNFGFSTCQAGSCQTLFTGLTGLYSLNNLNSFNSWAGTGSYAGSTSAFSNYQFTYTATTSFFGNKTTFTPMAASAETIQAPQAVPEPATWAMMIAGFAVVGMAMRRRAAVAKPA